MTKPIIVLHNIDMEFINRTHEISELNKIVTNGRLIVVYGRRRVGKTRLLARWLKKNNGIYSQCIDSNKSIQIAQIYQDIRKYCSIDIEPKTWQDLFALINTIKKPICLCIDEFPYLVKSDPSLPSIMQAWLDHRKNKNLSLILCGSSYHMLYQTFIDYSAPLYGRAFKLMQIEPMDYKDFCKALKLKKHQADTFSKYAFLGGVPKYWELAQELNSLQDYAYELFFKHAPYMQNEPMKLLMDENISGQHSLSVLEAIGRGASKPSEIAARLAMKQTQLSKVIYRLMDSSLVSRNIAFGEPQRSPKKVLYSISDPSLRFWYSVYSPHRSRWVSYSKDTKLKLIHDFASSVFEDFCRSKHLVSWKYWEKDLEFDCVQLKPDNSICVFEIKYSSLNLERKKSILKKLKQKWQQTKLAKKYPKVDFKVLDQSFLAK